MTTAPVACGQRGEEIWPVASSRGDLWATIPFECVPRAAGADEPRFAAARRHWSRRARPPRAPGRDLIDAHGTETSLSQCNTFVTAVHAPRRRSHARKGRLVPRASSLALGSRRAARARAWAAVMAGGSTKTVLVDMATGGALGGVTRPRGGGGPRGASAPPHTGGRSRRGSDRYRRDRPTPNPIPDPNPDPSPITAPRAVPLGTSGRSVLPRHGSHGAWREGRPDHGAREGLCGRHFVLRMIDERSRSAPCCSRTPSPPRRRERGRPGRRQRRPRLPRRARRQSQS